MATSLKIIFMGSPEIALPSLNAILGSRHKLIGIVSQPDRPAGRNMVLTAPAVADFARKKEIPLMQPDTVKNNAGFLAELQKLRPGIIAVVAYGKILPKPILDLPHHGCVNVHFSLLPKYRGAAPLQWALINGDEETGVTTFRLDHGIDTGPVYLQRKITIHEEDNAEILGQRLSVIGADLLVETLDGLAEDTLHALPQDNREATPAPPLKKEDGKIDWMHKAHTIWGQVRGMNPWPGAFTTLGGKRLRIYAAEPDDSKKAGRAGEILAAGNEGLLVACGSGALLIKELQLEGGKRLSADAFVKGHPLRTGEKIGS